MDINCASYYKGFQEIQSIFAGYDFGVILRSLAADFTVIILFILLYKIIRKLVARLSRSGRVKSRLEDYELLIDCAYLFLALLALLFFVRAAPSTIKKAKKVRERPTYSSIQAVGDFREPYLWEEDIFLS